MKIHSRIGRATVMSRQPANSLSQPGKSRQAATKVSTYIAASSMMQMIAAICFPVFFGAFSGVAFVSFMVILISYVMMQSQLAK
jgi:hypothetical protein